MAIKLALSTPCCLAIVPPAFHLFNSVTEATKSSGNKLRLPLRLLVAGAGSACLALVVTAAILEPDPRGHGTHEQLGLTPCYFRQWTGHACPTCGATTAWAHALRGDIMQAVAANLGGALLCGAAVIAGPWLLLSAMAGRWLVARPRAATLLVAATALLAVVLLDWLRRWHFG